MVWNMNMIPYNAKKCQNIVKIFKNFKNFLCQKLAVCLFTHAHQSSYICNTGITSIFQNLPVSAILVLPVFPRIFRYLQYSYFGNDQYLLVLQILENSRRYWDTSIYQYLYQYCRYWKILVKYWYYQYCVPVSRPAASYYPTFYTKMFFTTLAFQQFDHQLRPWILNCILCSATLLSLTARSDKASLSDLNIFYLFLCIGLPYTLHLIIRASLIKNTPRNYVTLFCK